MTTKDPQRYVMQLIVPAHLVGPIMEIMAGEGIMCEAKPYENGEPRKRFRVSKPPTPARKSSQAVPRIRC